MRTWSNNLEDFHANKYLLSLLNHRMRYHNDDWADAPLMKAPALAVMPATGCRWRLSWENITSGRRWVNSKAVRSKNRLTIATSGNLSSMCKITDLKKDKNQEELT